MAKKENTVGKNLDVFVIGSGIAGQTVAKACVAAGLKVAIADRREYGGTCANRGCDPKKVLLGATEAWEMTKNLQGKGLKKMPKIKWKKLQKFKRKFTSAVPKKTEENLGKLGIKLYHQSPKFLEENTLSVEGKTVHADKIVIATGYEPRKLPFDGAKLLKESDDFLNLKKLPKSIIFIGAGYIGMEFAHMAARSGSKVTIVDFEDRPLGPFDAELVKELTDYSKRLGIEFIFKADVKSIKKTKKKYKISYKKGSKTESVKAHMMFNTAGRIPSISDLDLESGNVAFDEKGIETDAYLQSKSNPNVYACGDVSDHDVPLTPLSGRQGYVVGENIVKGNKKKLDTPVIPSVVFTLPNLASVGYSEEEARDRYKNVVVKQGSVPDWFNAKRINAPVYAYKILLNERTEEIVGAHIIGPEAAETINLFTMAINNKMTAGDIKRTIFTYPSWANDVKSMV
ncbi:glutathione reductase (NADPH) [Pricia antarctica]|uniref:Glutathione reductase (NADPH) n=1 Tax=Pricia antarctica TaxID=641691 RepID=A0A1G6W2H7_9FLAO|nr:NAD(P)/FAD-dependent oxidoreductase [Pricia antarctica]SDD60009.1 glutathione reductase (NADPH) [Pricia antarctica]